MKKELSRQQADGLLATLQARFEKNTHRHPGLKWSGIAKKLERQPGKLWSLNEMENTGGEPDLVLLQGELLFVDCAPESPKGRRSLCYDTAALESRKEHKPKNSALGMAYEMGIEVLSEDRYHQLQQFGPLDTKTSSWLLSPEPIRQLGGAIFGDCRFGRVFIYHNGAESYYASRGFRGLLSI